MHCEAEVIARKSTTLLPSTSVTDAVIVLHESQSAVTGNEGVDDLEPLTYRSIVVTGPPFAAAYPRVIVYVPAEMPVRLKVHFASVELIHPATNPEPEYPV
jgi:hypothetical protein